MLWRARAQAEPRLVLPREVQALPCKPPLRNRRELAPGRSRCWSASLVSEYVRAMFSTDGGFENTRVQWGRSLAKPPVNPEIYMGLVTFVGWGLRSLMRGPHLAASISWWWFPRWMPWADVVGTIAVIIACLRRIGPKGEARSEACYID
jgi:hypothetical protein